MEQKQKVWIYCHTSVPDDRKGLLKSQQRQLLLYARQMDAQVIGSSGDMGQQDFESRSGFRFFLAQARKSQVQALYILNAESVADTGQQWQKFVDMMKRMNMQVFSPRVGCMIGLQDEGMKEQAVLCLQ